MREGTLKKYHAVYMDVWKYFKKHAEADGVTDDNAKACMEDGRALVAKYPDIPRLASGMVALAQMELESIGRDNQ